MVFAAFLVDVEADLDLLLQTHRVTEATCVFLQMEQMTGDLSASRLAVVMAEAAKTSGKNDTTGMKDHVAFSHARIMSEYKVLFLTDTCLFYLTTSAALDRRLSRFGVNLNKPSTLSRTVS